MTLLYLARHGETDDNARHVFQGQGGKGLNARGRAQARRLAERMHRARPTTIVVSDLERAVETARAVAELCGLEPRLDPGLREVDVGLWTGKSHEQIAAEHPEEWAAWSAGLDGRRGGGETYAELSQRIEDAITSICADEPRGPILVVSHGGAIKSYVARILGIPSDQMTVLTGAGNCSLSLIERDTRGRSRLHTWNDTAHLEGLLVDDRAD